MSRLTARKVLGKLTEKSVERHGLRVAYFHSPGKGMPLVFIHGLFGSSSGFYQQIDFFQKKGRRIICIDLRGHGRSSVPPRLEQYSCELIAEDVYEILKAEGIKRAHLIGHSMGSMVAQAFHCRHPECTASMILIATTDRPIRARLFPAILDVLGKRLFSLAGSNKQGDYVEYSMYRNTGDLSLFRYLADIRICSWKSAIGGWKAVVNYSNPKFSRISCPLLIIHGKSDIFINRAHIEKLAASTSTAKLVVVASGHMAILNNAAEVTAAMRDFLEEKK